MLRKILLQSIILFILPIFCLTNKLVNIKFEEVAPNFQQTQAKDSKPMTLSQLIETIYRNPQSLLDMKNIYIERWPIPDPSNTSQKNKTTQSIKSNPSEIQSSPQSSPILPAQSKQNKVGSNQIARKPVSSTEAKASTSSAATNPSIGGNQTSSNLRRAATNSATQNDIQSKSTSGVINSNSNIIQTNLPQSKPETARSLENLRAQMIQLTNNLRKKHNVKQLVANSLLTKIAQDHSNDMATRNFFDHANPDGERVGDRAKKNNFFGSIGQNLAFAPTLNQAQIGFQNSPTHFANAIKSNWQQIGVGIAIKGPMMYVTVLFSPKNIATNKLSKNQIQNFKVQLSNAIKVQSPNLKTYDTALSQYIQEYLQGNRGTSLMSYVVSRGKYRSPMTAASYTMDYTSDFVNRAIENKYFQNQHKNMSKFGIGIVQNMQKLQINVIYM